MPKSGLRVAFEVDECDERLGGESAEGEVLQKVKRRERKAQTFDPSKVARAKDEAPTETLATLAPKRYTVATEKVTTLEEELKTRCGVLGARRRQSASLFGEAVRCAEKAAALQRALQRVHGAGAGAVLGGAWQRKWLSELEVGLNRLELTGSSAETLLKVLEHHGWTSDPLEDGSGHFSGDNPPDLNVLLKKLRFLAGDLASAPPSSVPETAPSSAPEEWPEEWQEEWQEEWPEEWQEEWPEEWQEEWPEEWWASEAT
ncbi:unnamed protein product [Durusdinium trenchii]|uniref:Uncharacterized protein n=1 Tax=Durusdinium trenchii TaxID=1381693 RepID=A0ABP0KXM1_9DINO